MRLVRYLPAILLAACAAEPRPPQAAEPPDAVASAEALTVIDCPWGIDQCAWPGKGDAAKALHVGTWKTGTGTTAKVARADLLAKFVMQGSGFVSEVVFSASRDGVQDGALWVELRADAVKPETGRLLARGRKLVSNASDAALAEFRVPLHTVAPVTRLTDGTAYWLRAWVAPTDRKRPAAVWLDSTSIAPVGMALRTCGTSAASWPSSCTTFVGAADTLLAFRPTLEALAAPSCEDRLKNGAEAGRDCGKAACNVGCGKGSLCGQDGDCFGSVCRPTGIGPGETDALCGPEAGDARLTCSCVKKLDLGSVCGADVDCLSGVCQGNPGTPNAPARCVAATCRSGTMDGNETGVDCGGSCARKCLAGTVCRVNADCDQGLLCGGDAKPYTCRAARGIGSACRADWQCETGACVAKFCRAVGGVAAYCDTKPDCDSGVCTSRRCAAPKYTDRTRNGSETDVDCGGTGTGFKACVAGRRCVSAGDCKAGLTCGGGLCGAALQASCSRSADCLSGLCGKPTGATKSLCLEKYPDGDSRHCMNGVTDANETALDCGGGVCDPCADKLTCGGPNDCVSGVCTTAGLCAPPACNDGVRNGGEGAVDCGGTSRCGKCAPGIAVSEADSCASGVRSVDLGVCLDATCFDGLRNGAERGVDCGGGACAPCDTGTCTTKTAALDCASGVCAATLTCSAPTAIDKVRNGDETDADCGGTTGKGCALRKRCAKDGDCVSGAYCVNAICAPQSCTNKSKDKTLGEVDVDCGGPCGLCNDGKDCTAATQCASGVCTKAAGATAKTCAAPTATDTVKNGDELGVDCGGPNAPGCGYASVCKADGDCAGGMVCLGGRCNFGQCGNTTKTSVAATCGRLCSTRCGSGEPCRGSVDCGSAGECVEGPDGQPKCVTRKCTIGDDDYKPGEQHPDDPCRACDPEAAPVASGDVGAFVERAAGDVCDDHDPGTYGDRCRGTGSLTCSGDAFTCTVGPDESCVAKNEPVPDGQRCDENADCDVAGAIGGKTCVNGRCEGAQCKAALYGRTRACGFTGECVSGGRCDGVSRTCPVSHLLVDVECRAALSPCDEPERCDGVSAACPTTDVSKSAGDECLAGTKGGHCRSDSGALACVPCALDEKWNGSTCEACPSGSASAGGAATECQSISCAVNKYWPGTGTTCVPCPEGSTSPGGAVAECTPVNCSAGQYWSGTECTECATGQWSVGGAAATCTNITCAKGQYLDTSTSTCSACPDGQWSTGAVTACTAIACTTTQYWDTSSGACKACPTGQSSGGAATTCLTPGTAPPGSDWLNTAVPHGVGSRDPDTNELRPNQASYTVSTSGNRVKDNVTGLEWQRAMPTTTYDWAGAKTYCDGLVLDGLTDWRLPTRIELVSIVDRTRYNPSIDATAFPNTPSDLFWTSTPWAGASSPAWHVHFIDGTANYGLDVSSNFRLRCVR